MRADEDCFALTRQAFPTSLSFLVLQDMPDRLLAWTAPARRALRIDPALPDRSGTQRQRDAAEGGASIQEVFAAEVVSTQSSYAAEGVAT